MELLGACRSLPQQCQLSLYKRQVSLHIELFEACSTFTRVTARTLAESLNDPFHRRLQPARYLPHCSDCYRPERPLPGGTYTLSRTVPFHGTRLSQLTEIAYDCGTFCIVGVADVVHRGSRTELAGRFEEQI